MFVWRPATNAPLLQASYTQGRLFKIKNISDVDATLIEPASCAMHGLEKIAPKAGSHALLIGAGPTGLMMAQFLYGQWFTTAHATT